MKRITTSRQTFVNLANKYYNLSADGKKEFLKNLGMSRQTFWRRMNEYGLKDKKVTTFIG